MGDLESYPYRKTMDCRSAIGATLAEFLRGMSFALPKTTVPFQLAAVYNDWATFNDTASTAGGKLPAAAVLLDRPTYEDAEFVPHMIESTWSGGDPTECTSGGQKLYPIGDGSGDGYALFATCELTVPIVVVIRAVSKPMRRAIMSVFEDAFVEDGSLPDPGAVNPVIPNTITTRPIRFGRLLKMDHYYQRPARYTLQSQQILTTSSTAMENKWMAQLELVAQARVCVLRRVRAMRPRVRIQVDEVEDDRAQTSG